jgi:5-methylcytosine-specific restriction protein B
MKYLSPEHMVAALKQLSEFRAKVRQQEAKHVLPLLSIFRKGIDELAFRPYAEADDFEFFDRFFKITGGENPYFDPISSRFRIKTHPHSNVATARKGTFAYSWKAAEFRPSSPGPGEEWKLAADYIDRITKKVLTKGKVVTPIPIAPLATFIYRKEALPDDVTVEALMDRFEKDFNIAGARKSLFSRDHAMGGIAFSTAALMDEALERLILDSGFVVEEPRQVPPPSSEIQLKISDEDPILRVVLRLVRDDGMAGVVLVGPPGTSKSWYAVQIALFLTEGDRERIANIQFHKSYQYENFVESYVPRTDGGGFRLRDQVLLRLARRAEGEPEKTFVILIDEISRSDPGRVFGEILTYMEPTRRGELFTLPSGRRRALPRNLVFIATMNARDKSVTEIDDAFDRRLAKIPLEPDADILRALLEASAMPEPLRERVVGFFEWVNQRHYPLGHTFFRLASDTDSLRRLWDYQLRFVFEKAFRFEPDVVKTIREKYAEIVLGAAPAAGSSSAQLA